MGIHGQARPHLDSYAAIVKQALVEQCEQCVEDGTVGLEDLINERNLGDSDSSSSGSRAASAAAQQQCTSASLGTVWAQHQHALVCVAEAARAVSNKAKDGCV
jgi:hypothetical protein